MWLQQEITLSPKSRGFHLVTGEIERQLPQLASLQVGLAHLFLLHTSASLSINENADPSVRADMEAHFNQLMPEHAPYYQHTCEGADDMPAHLKSSALGCSLSVPVSEGRFRLGTWQGIYLGEHRNSGGRRHLLATLQGQ